MLKDSDFQKLLDEVMPIYREIETLLINDIARMLVDGEIQGGSTDWYIRKLQEMGALDQKTLRRISRLTKLSESRIHNVIETAVSKSLDMGTFVKAYEMGLVLEDARKLNLKPVINDISRELNGELKVFITNAIEGKNKDFAKIVTQAYVEQSVGAYSYDQSITRAVKNLSEKGITTATYMREGKPVEYSLEAVVRRYVMTNIGQSANKANEVMAEHLETETFYVSQHLGARDKGTGHQNHANWQGKVYTKEELGTVCGLGKVDGISGVNCRHIYYAYIEGVSVPPDERINEVDNAVVYAQEQKQRMYERGVREAKRRISALKELYTDDMSIEDKERLDNEVRGSKKLLKNRLDKLDAYFKNNDNLTRDYSRERIVEPKKTKVPDNLAYSNVTQEWLDNVDPNRVGSVIENDYVNVNGETYTNQNAHLDMDFGSEEIKNADWLKSTFNEDVRLVPRPSVNGQTLSSSDYIFMGENWDLKSIKGSGKDVVRDRVRKGKQQANNFVIDITDETKLSVANLDNQTKNLFTSFNTQFVETAILKKGDELIAIYKRKR
ncbi:hypothetical protein G7062_11310 [Erysipelothrix sp. HDW6C]|uniref:phage minor capsid protein n=1 Tax=Erysipelothrix sp. HDW6C TaxID=2714930 RepID=UPI001408AA13|nr:phage minor capsid protein [Erysipelothrix sp. HDW6C]QIK70846.1 hypothetical protein G7062_11310 [Erysipelothrix sp. HDW6C]